jgi:signal transduction histidine kinase
MKRIALILFLSIGSVYCHSQSNKIDSLQAILPKNQSEYQFQVLKELVRATWHTDTELALKYSREAIKLAKGLGKMNLEASSLNMSAWVHMYRSDFDSAFYFGRRALRMAILANDSIEIYGAYNTIGSFHKNAGDLHAALYNYLLSHRIATKINDTNILPAISGNISVVYNQLDDFERAIDYAVKAIELSKNSPDLSNLIWAKTALSGAYHSIGRIEEEEALCISVIELSKTINEKFIRAIAHQSLGRLYTEMHRQEAAKQNFDKSIELLTELKSEDFKMISYSGLGTLYSDQQPDSALYFFRKSQTIAKKKMRSEDMLLIYENFIPYFKQNNMEDSVLLYQSRYIELKKSQERENNSRTIKGVLATIEEEENLRLLSAQRANIEAKNRLFQSAVAIITLLIILLSISFLFYRSNQKTNKRLKVKNIESIGQKEQLELLNEEKNKLIGMVAHDLRTPLNSVKGLINLTLLEENEAEKEHFMELIAISTDRMTDMVNRILDVSALESKTLNLKMEQVDLVEILNQLIVVFRINAEKKNQKMQLINNCDSALVVIDKNYFIQVLENLVSNAVKYSEYGTEINIQLDREKDDFLITVRDQGPGISEEDQNELFKEYSTLSSMTTGGEKSTGLGLSIVKKYVEAMQGKIWCKSELGMGSRFILQFGSVPAVKRGELN